jgi:hypothetical protein
MPAGPEIAPEALKPYLGRRNPMARRTGELGRPPRVHEPAHRRGNAKPREMGTRPICRALSSHGSALPLRLNPDPRLKIVVSRVRGRAVAISLLAAVDPHDRPVRRPAYDLEAERGESNADRLDDNQASDHGPPCKQHPD